MPVEHIQLVVRHSILDKIQKPKMEWRCMGNEEFTNDLRDVHSYSLMLKD